MFVILSDWPSAVIQTWSASGWHAGNSMRLRLRGCKDTSRWVDCTNDAAILILLLLSHMGTGQDGKEGDGSKYGLQIGRL